MYQLLKCNHLNWWCFLGPAVLFMKSVWLQLLDNLFSHHVCDGCSTVAVRVGQSSLSWIWSLSASFATTSFLLNLRSVWKRLMISRRRNEVVARCCLLSCQHCAVVSKKIHRVYGMLPWWRGAVVIATAGITVVALSVCCVVLMLYIVVC